MGRLIDERMSRGNSENLGDSKSLEDSRCGSDNRGGAARYVPYALAVAGVTAIAFWGSGALAQYTGSRPALSGVDVLNASAVPSEATGKVRCPASPVTVKFDNGATVTWIGQEGNACVRELRLSSGDTTRQLWYAPGFTMAANTSSAFVDQLKPSKLWPLKVGETLTGRFDGPGLDPSFMGSWVYKVTVDDYKKFFTHAGDFDVFVVTREEESIGGTFKSKLREWYAPSLGVSVRTAYGDNDGVSGVQEAVSIKR